MGSDLLKIDAEINKEKINIQLFDTAGQERYHSLAKNYIRNADGVLLLYDVTNEESFKSVDQWISYIKEIDDENKIEIILIGNKIDEIEKRLISKKKAKDKSNKYNIKYYEICCLNGLNLYEVFNEIIFGGYYKYYENEKEKKKDYAKITNNNKKKKKKKKKCC